MSRPSLVRSHISTYSQISSKDPDTVMSQNSYGPTTPLSQKSNRQLGYDPNTPNGTGAPLLRTSPSQETPQPARFVSPPPTNPGSRSSTSAGGPSTAVIPRPGTAQTIQPRDRSMSQSNTQSYWGPLPRNYNSDSYDLGSRPTFYKRHSYNDYENMGAQFEDSDTQALDPTPRTQAKQASVEPFPTDVQRIPVNADSPLHQLQQVRRAPSDSFRSLRYDTKKRSYRFDNLSDVESENAGRGVQSGSFYRNGRPSTPVEEILRLPLTWWMNSTAKNHFVAMIGEFVGTTMFLFFAFAGTQVANIQASTTTTTNATNGFSPIVLLYTAVSFGFSLMVNVWIFFRISGGLFNP
ncbi:hypothetical protein KCU73_g6773, partial [Aureobasidium melanogenum]